MCIVPVNCFPVVTLFSGSCKCINIWRRQGAQQQTLAHYNESKESDRP